LDRRIVVAAAAAALTGAALTAMPASQAHAAAADHTLFVAPTGAETVTSP
jgi:hypothetical protein